MTKQELLRENGELKDRIIELQSAIIRLKTVYTPTKEIKIIEREIVRERDVSPFEPYYSIYPSYYTGDPLPSVFEHTCGRNAMEWDEKSKTFI